MRTLTDDEGDLELLDAVADGDKLARTPHETRLLDRTHRFLELDHVRLVVPRLDIERHDGLTKDSIRHEKKFERILKDEPSQSSSASRPS